MKLEVRRIPPLAAARVVAAVFGVVALVVTVFGGLLATVLPGTAAPSGLPTALAAVLVPLGWWLSTFVFTAASCAVYNLLAERLGGIVLEASPVAAGQGPA